MTALGRLLMDQSWRESKISSYASVGILFFLTSFFWGASRDFMQVVYGLSFFAPVLFVLLLRRPSFQEYGGWFTGLALLYGAYATLSSLWSQTPRPFFFAYHLLFLAVWLAGVCWLFRTGKVDITRVYKVIVFAGAVCGLVLLVVFYWEKPFSIRLGTLGYGVAKNSNTLGYLYGATTLVAYVLWLGSSGRRQAWTALALMLANLLPFLATQSRSAFVGFVIAVVIAFFSVTKSASKLAAHGLLLFVLVGVVLLEWDFVSKTVSARFNERFYRDAVWPHELQASYGDHFFFGSGLVKTSRISVPGSDLPPFNHCHSAYIDALYRTGIVGLVLMLSHLIFVLSHWSRDPRLLPLFLWLFLTCVMSIFDHPGFFWYLEPLWFAYWIPAGLIGALVMAGKQKSAPA